MPVSYNNFVKVNFDVEQEAVLAGSYSVSALISKEVTKGDKIYSDFNSFTTDYQTTSSELYKAVKIYFDNGGVSLKLIKRESEESIPQVLDRIKKDDFIMFACSDTLIDSEVQAVGQWLAARKSSERKIFVVTDTNENAKNSESEDSLYSKVSQMEYIALKYSKVNNAAVSIMAYFSNINLNGNKTIKDYCFTSEALPIEDITQQEYETLEARNYNVDIQVGLDYTFNNGGNMANGIAIDERWALIAVENDIVKALMRFLVNKNLMDDESVIKIKATVNSVLSRYTTNGLLKTGYIYEGATKVVDRNGKEYELLGNGQILQSGYMTYVLPISSLTPTEVASKTAPSVYVYLAVAGGIREVAVEGVVVR